MPADITLSDIVAVLLFIMIWISTSLLSNRYFKKNKTTLYTISKSVRNQWVLRMLGRENRIADVNLLGHLMRSVSFFASTSLLVLAGLITVFGVVEDAISITNDIPFAQHVSVSFWKLKLLLVVLIFVFVFFKLVWSIRQYNASIIMIGAAPDEFESDAELQSYGANLGTIMNRASRHFIEGMRGYEFALAALAWFIHPLLFILATLIVALVTYRREFASRTMKAMNDEP